MTTIADVISYLESFAPLDLAESWDNVGLLLGDQQPELTGVLSCLTLTPDVAAEAISRGVNLIVTHHPILFRPVQTLTANTSEGRMLLELARAGIAVYSPHTAFDSATAGINAGLAERFELQEIQPIRVKPEEAEVALPRGAGRWGKLAAPETFLQFVHRVKYTLGLLHAQVVAPALLELDGRIVGSHDVPVQTVGIACGSAGEFLTDAHQLGCNVFVTGETRFHTALQARDLGMGLVLVGHHASERPAVEDLARQLAQEFPDVVVKASEVERDPLEFA